MRWRRGHAPQRFTWCSSGRNTCCVAKRGYVLHNLKIRLMKGRMSTAATAIIEELPLANSRYSRAAGWPIDSYFYSQLRGAGKLCYKVIQQPIDIRNNSLENALRREIRVHGPTCQPTLPHALFLHRDPVWREPLPSSCPPRRPRYPTTMTRFGDFQPLCRNVPSYPWCNLFYREVSVRFFF